MITRRRLVQTIFLGGLVLTGLLALAPNQPDTLPVDSIVDAPYYHDSELLDRAWALPVTDRYKPYFEYQINGAFCGPATVVDLFHSLGVHDLTQSTIFDKSDVSYWKARIFGLTLDEVAELVEANGDLEVTVLRDLTFPEFREQLRHTNDLAYRYLINFNRAPLFGVNVGHHSPLGGYLEDHDLVFVLDVLEEYRPFLVPSERLYEAMNTLDMETGKKRGLIRVRPSVAPSTTHDNAAITR
ncbi:MAG: phytochelatin synthase [Gammaproteobacteria bacterium]|nr:phytochelatin synthase [Gammaproteobacteria bacterium]MCP5426109.1 phytochelatin synthase [Gammaproteobacteria bacterium]MCP5460000.1 phytochelatin synthase [Gammaproteobacteria bacterium]